MKDSSTQMGGLAAPLRSTQWSMVLRAKNGTEEDFRKNFEALIRIYWKPVYTFLRRKRGEASEDAKDLTQAFFAQLLEKPFLSNVTPEKGKFRTYMLVCLRNFLNDQYESAKALKRGGGHKIVSLDFITSDDDSPREPVDSRTPEEGFSRAWGQAVVKEAVTKLRAAYTEEGRNVYFSVFNDYDLSEDRKISYSSIAEKYGISATDVTNYLSHARKRFRSIVRDVVRESVFDEAELPAELNFLFGSSP